jgi:hypothetical protein
LRELLQPKKVRTRKFKVYELVDQSDQSKPAWWTPLVKFRILQSKLIFQIAIRLVCGPVPSCSSIYSYDPNLKINSRACGYFTRPIIMPSVVDQPTWGLLGHKLDPKAFKLLLQTRTIKRPYKFKDNIYEHKPKWL